MNKSDRQKTDRAVALHYDGRHAPVVTAKGSGETARQIRELAAAHGVPLREDDGLVQLLSQVELGDAIPEPLYRAVAEILVFAYALTNRSPPLAGGGQSEPKSGASDGGTPSR